MKIIEKLISIKKKAIFNQSKGFILERDFRIDFI
jgi:hypothetical protein